MSPHTPYFPEDDEKEFFADAKNEDFERAREKITRWIETAQISAKGWDQNELYVLNGLYDSKLKRGDKLVGSIYDKLKELNLEKNTLIIISADHAENLGEHDIFGHGTLPWDTVIKVPLIIVYPPLIPSGIKVKGLTESVDIMPTIINACGIKLPRGKSMDGVSLLKFIRNPGSGKKAVFSIDSIRTEKYKCMFDPNVGDSNHLYDLDKDPGEEKNIAFENPLIFEKYRQRLEASMKPYHDRFEETKKTSPPDYPFYFSIFRFRITSMGIIKREEGEIKDTANFLNETSLQEPLLLFRRAPERSFLFIPKNGLSSPIALSTKLPNGAYYIFVLLESLSEVPLSPQQLGFQFRFNPQNSFNFPYKINSIEEEKESEISKYWYLDLGEIQVNEESFFLEFKFQPLDNKQYIMHFIKFVPVAMQKENQTKEFNEEDSIEQGERIKSLGYL